ncbi:hypothetical protein ACP275_08G194400 [Erythranthe tilingii]
MGHRNTQFTDQQQQGHSNFYGTSSNFPQPNIHSVVPAPINQSNFNFHHHMPDHHQDNPLLYAVPQMNAAPSSHFNNPYLPPPVHLNHGTHSMVGVPFKRKNADVAAHPWIYPYYNNASVVGPSSSVESDVALMDNSRMMVQGCFVAPPHQLPGNNNPWLDMHFASNNGDVGNFAWAHPPLPYVQVVDGFPNGPHPQGQHNPHHWMTPPMQGARGGYNANIQSQIATSSRNRTPAISPFQEMVDTRPTFVAPIPSMGFRLYQPPQQREIVLGSNIRHHHTLPHLRILPEDEVAILEIPGYREAGGSIDQHRDMRLDIDHMSYEELLALGEQIGSVRTGLSDEFIRQNLKIRYFASSASSVNLEKEICEDHQINLCVVCQTDYKEKEEIGTIDCGHEYHKECIKKWLIVKNSCPVCKSTALSNKAVNL